MLRFDPLTMPCEVEGEMFGRAKLDDYVPEAHRKNF